MRIDVLDYYTKEDWLPIREEARKHPSPFLVVNLNIIKRKYEELLAHFPFAKIYYAVKANPAPEVIELLRDLGVFKLFVFSAASDDAGTETTQWSAPEKNNSLLTAAETVTEAHEVLVEADEANAARFDQVIEFARKDVERLKKDQ